MGQKDKREKLLEDYEDVFSDIFNVLVFQNDVIKQEYLRASPTVSIYKAENGNYNEQLRDILKEYNNEFMLGIGSLGIENQSSVDKYIPVRVMGYDYTNYRSQIDRNKFPILPVITIVLNFSDTAWNDTKSLFEIMMIPEEFKPYVQDYKVMVFDIAYLKDEVIERFTSDFKLIAKFFKDRRLGKLDFLESGDNIKHVQEFIDFLRVFTNDARYNDIKQDVLEMQKKGRDIKVCTIVQFFEDKGIEKGRAMEIIDLGNEYGMTDTDILNKLQDKLKITLNAAEEYLKSLKTTN